MKVCVSPLHKCPIPGCSKVTVWRQMKHHVTEHHFPAQSGTCPLCKKEFQSLKCHIMSKARCRNLLLGYLTFAPCKHRNYLNTGMNCQKMAATLEAQSKSKIAEVVA